MDAGWRLTARAAVTLVGLVVVLALATGLLFVVGGVLGLALILALGGVPRSPLAAAAPFGATAAMLGLVGSAAAAYGRRGDLIETTREPEKDGRDLETTAERLAGRYGISAPTLRVIETPDPIALVTRVGREQYLLVSTGLVDALTDEEFEAVLAHEFAHLVNGDLRMTRLSLVPVLAASAIRFLGRVRRGRVNVVLLVLCWLPGLLLEALSGAVAAFFLRGRELAADRAAARVVGNPGALASALRTLDAAVEERPVTDLRAISPTVAATSIVSGGGWIAEGIGFSTHPSTERRIEALRAIERELETGSE